MDYFTPFKYNFVETISYDLKIGFSFKSVPYFFLVTWILNRLHDQTPRTLRLQIKDGLYFGLTKGQIVWMSSPLRKIKSMSVSYKRYTKMVLHI